MKKKFLVLIILLAAMLCAGFGLVGCEWLSALTGGHTHNPSSSWQSDSTHHWHGCTEGNCNEQIDKAEHTSSSYIYDSEGHYKICSVCSAKFDEGTHTDGESCTICGYNPDHIHSLEHVEAKEATCTESGNVEYWHCTGCNMNYSSQSATTVLDTVVISSTGHSIVTMHDGANHWKECETCRTVIVSAQSHTCTTYIKSKAGHYKICTECGVKYDEGTHADGESCLICGYTPNYEDMCASDYGFNYLGTLENGGKYQSFYEAMDGVVKGFHTDGTKDAKSVTISNDTAYIAGEVNYASLGLSVNEAQSVWATYRHDHPLYYWLLGQVAYNSQSLSLCVDSNYKDGSARAAQNELIYTAIDGYLNAVEGETSVYQTAFAFHDMIIDKIDYARDGEGNAETANWAHGILGVFSGEGAVCEGYAKAFALLLNASGIDNVYVTGSSKGVGHAWNMVKIDGNWYWYDLTWDDQPEIGSGTIYDYMCRSGEVFTDHIVGKTGDMSNPMGFLYVLPTAATAEYNTASLECGEQFTLDGLTYELCGYNELSIIKSSSLSGEVVLQSNVTYEGRIYTLTQIGTNAFRYKYLTALTIPESVKVINNLAFNGCSRLNRITFEDKEGWSRTCRGNTQIVSSTSLNISSTSLNNASDAATLLKETYKVGVTMYEYVWVKSPSA